MTEREKAVTAFLAQAVQLGYSVIPTSKLLKCLGASIASRLTSRNSRAVYQTAEYSLQNFPRKAAEQIFAPYSEEAVAKNSVKWTCRTFPSLRATLAPVLMQSDYDCAGLSRALRPPSESVIRVLGTILPGAEFSWIGRGGKETLLCKFMYTLVDETSTDLIASGSRLPRRHRSQARRARGQSAANCANARIAEPRVWRDLGALQRRSAAAGAGGTRGSPSPHVPDAAAAPAATEKEAASPAAAAPAPAAAAPAAAEDGGGAAPEADDAGQRAWGDAAPPLSDVVKKALDEAVNKETLALEMLKCCPPDQLLQALEPNKGLVWPIHDLLDVETLEKVGGVMGVPVPRTSSARTWATKVIGYLEKVNLEHNKPQFHPTDKCIDETTRTY
ncbi:hypothetical protein AB1Y20_023689 [Prymnesium parvum]|uniref:Uncharacterized protein n=1 Tax=Prymnesium parvum TaxID=97485 RepID=A0AB34JF94_PRYPA